MSTISSSLFSFLRNTPRGAYNICNVSIVCRYYKNYALTAAAHLANTIIKSD